MVDGEFRQKLPFEKEWMELSGTRAGQSWRQFCSRTVEYIKALSQFLATSQPSITYILSTVIHVHLLYIRIYIFNEQTEKCIH
jgi:hypothetical protein